MSRCYKVWTCKIGVDSTDRIITLPHGADSPMREAIKKAFKEVTGLDAEFTFSGWAGKLTEAEANFLKEEKIN